MNQYTLPPLPYEYDALEPHISRDIMRFHHDQHHATYVKKANLAVRKIHDARKREDFERLPLLEKQLAFNVSGHILHSIFWRNMTPKGGGEPSGTLRDAIEADFGSFGIFRQHMIETAVSVMGSGWAALMWEPVGQGLVIAQVHDHQANMAQASLPLMVMDAWEHAYYLQYQNRKQDFFEAIWNLWNWDDVTDRFERARATVIDLPEAGVPEEAAPHG